MFLCKLKNGAILPSNVLSSIMDKIVDLFLSDSRNLLYELIEKASDPDEIISAPEVIKELSQLNLMYENGNLDQDVKNVVLSGLYLFNNETPIMENPVLEIFEL